MDPARLVRPDPDSGFVIDRQKAQHVRPGILAFDFPNLQVVTAAADGRGFLHQVIIGVLSGRLAADRVDVVVPNELRSVPGMDPGAGGIARGVFIADQGEGGGRVGLGPDRDGHVVDVEAGRRPSHRVGFVGDKPNVEVPSGVRGHVELVALPAAGHLLVELQNRRPVHPVRGCQELAPVLHCGEVRIEPEAGPDRLVGCRRADGDRRRGQAALRQRRNGARKVRSPAENARMRGSRTDYRRRSPRPLGGARGRVGAVVGFESLGINDLVPADRNGGNQQDERQKTQAREFLHDDMPLNSSFFIMHTDF